MNYMNVPRVLLGVLGLVFAVVFVLSDREWGIADVPRVEAMKTLPDVPELARVRRFTEAGSVFIPYTPRQQSRRANGGFNPNALQVGYGYREVSILRLPFWVYADFGPFTFYERPWGYTLSGYGAQEKAAINRVIGRDIDGHRFPWWRHVWGWLFVIAGLGILFLHLRALRRWREETGII